MKKPATICAALLVILGAWEIGVLWHSAEAAPRDDEWQRARASLNGQFQPGDLIVFAPPWVDPVGRRWFGDLMAVEDAARMDAARYARVWEVTIRGDHSPDATGTLASDQNFGAVHVRRFDRPAAQVLADLRARSKLREVDFTPRLCVPMRPPYKVDLTTDTGLGTKLAVYGGIADFRSRRENQARALLRILVDGKEIAHASIGNDSGWFALPIISLPPDAKKIVFDSVIDPAHSKGGSGPLDLCIAAEARQ